MVEPVPEHLGESDELGDETPQAEPAPTPIVIPVATLLAIALAIGIAIGWHQARPVVWPWVAMAFAMIVLAAWLRRTRAVIGLLMLAVIGLGAARVVITQRWTAPDDVAAFVGDTSLLVHLRGVVTQGPIQKQRTTGSMAKFDYRKPVTSFPMRVDALLDREGRSHAMRGRVLVRVDETLAPFGAGDTVEVRGFLSLPGPPQNPGEFDLRRYARSLGQAGIVTVASRELVQVTSAPRWSVWGALLNWRDELRRRAGGWLLADLPDSDSPQRDWLLVNLLLGEREAQIDGSYEAFQRVGLAHVLAISGFHLSVLAGLVLLVLRLGGTSRRWHGVLVIGVVVLYLWLVEVRMPVLRAGVMTTAACLALVFGRRLRVSGLVAFSALVLLLWRPDELFNPGFQLTYGVVLGLIHLTGPVRERLFGRHDPEAGTAGAMLGHWLKTAAAVSLVAWMVATPIGLYHFGMFSPLGAPLSIVAVPISAVLLAIGYAKTVLSLVLPSAAMLLGVPLSIGADVLLAIVKAADGFPGSMLKLPNPSVVWTLLALAWVCWWCLGRRRHGWRRAAMSATAMALVIWLVFPVIAPSGGTTLRIDMLAVGDSSCYVLRSGGSTVVFDAGSSTNLDAGRRTIIPAMRRLGVRAIDAIAVSHPDIDHYSAVIELADEFDVGQVLVTPQFLQAAERDAASSAAHLVDALTERRVMIVKTAAGETLTFGGMEWSSLHPPADAYFQRDNDGSMVVQVNAGGHTTLLCGDIQQQGVGMLTKHQENLRADVMELPHHGSFNEEVALLVKKIGPGVIMQSTGWTRWQRDQWTPHLSGIERLVTARDGACWIEMDEKGEIRTGRFAED